MKLTGKISQNPAFDPLLCVAEAATYLSIHPETLKKLVRLREITCVRNSRKKGSNIRFRLSALNSWIAGHEIKARRSLAVS